MAKPKQVIDLQREKERAAKALTDTDEFKVEYDFTPADNGQMVELGRYVWRKARYRKDQEIVFHETVLRVKRDEVPNLMRDLAFCLAV